MSPRVTRAAAARLSADIEPTSSENTTPLPHINTNQRKRKAASTDHASRPTPSPGEHPSRIKRARVEEALKSSTASGRREIPQTATLIMSDAGPSSTTSREASPSRAPRASSKRKSTRKPSREADANTPIPASTSRRSKRGSRKDHDALVKDVDEKREKEGGALEDDQTRADRDAPQQPPSTALDAHTHPQGDDSPQDPFTSAFLGRFAGHSGLSSSLRALSGLMSGTHTRLRNILEQLRMKDDPTMQMVALQELSELLLVSNEDNLTGHFAPDLYVKELVALMQPNEFTGEENPEIMLLACRCIANMMEALPAATASVVYGGAVPILCQKLLEIHFIDLAEQALSTLEKISVEFPASIVREGGLTACLTYLDFFATSTQRTAVVTAANCCRNIPDESFSTVRDVMPILLTTLSSNDQRVVEQASLCVCRIVDSFRHDESKLEDLVSTELLAVILRLLLPASTNMIGPSIHTQFLRVLSTASRASPRLSTELLKMNVVDTLYQILTGVSPPPDGGNLASEIDKNIIMQAVIRAPREQIFETLDVACELLPNITRNGSVFIDDLFDTPSQAGRRVSMSTRSKTAPNDRRIELLRGCSREVRRFAIILFPTLMHVYTSTVNLSVRQKVLTAQLKMLSNLDIDILEDALRGITYASHIASIFTQQESTSLFTYALQAAELLLMRLGNIYRPQFYREGVMAEISHLAERSLLSETNVGVGLTDQAGTNDKNPKDLDPCTDDTRTTFLNDAATEQPSLDALEGEKSLADKEAAKSSISDKTSVTEMTADANEQSSPDDDDDDDDDDEDNDDDNELAREDEDAMDEDGEEIDQSDDSISSSPATTFAPNSVQDIITQQARKFMEVYDQNADESMQSSAKDILDGLHDLGSQLESCYLATDHDQSASNRSALFQRLAEYFSSDTLESITSYEMLKSNIVDVLLKIMSSDSNEKSILARSDFLQVFTDKTHTSTNGPELSRAFVGPFTVLLSKLQELLSRSEHFEVVTVHHNAFESNRNSAASMLAKQLRLKLTADDESEIPRHFRNIMVSIHAIATFKALDDYLRPRINAHDRPRSTRARDGISSAMAAYTAAMAGREGFLGAMQSGLPDGMSPLLARASARTGTAKASPPSADLSTALEKDSVSQGATLHIEKTLRSRGSSEAGQTHRGAESLTLQESLECADETQLEEQENDDNDNDDDDDDGDDGDENDDDEVGAELDALVNALESEALDESQEEPSAINVEVAQSGKVIARTDDGAQVSTPRRTVDASTVSQNGRTLDQPAAKAHGTSAPSSSSRPMSYASALQQEPDWHIEFSINGQPIASETTIYRACHFYPPQGENGAVRSVWGSTHIINFKRVAGPPRSDRVTPSPAESSTTYDKSSSLPLSLDKHSTTSSILRLMRILHELNSTLSKSHTDLGGTSTSQAEPLSHFVNTKLTAKLNRQLEEPLIVASSCLPSWAEDLARLCPFLFPFETRHLFLQSTSFGYARSMLRWQNVAAENDSRSHHRDDRPFLGRLQRQKVRISRTRILESAVKVMELYGGSQSILEVEYFEEVGTGLGPTLEFYSTVSKELSKKKLRLWRENDSALGDEYAFGRSGLFPMPMSPGMLQSESGQRVLHLFTILGKFVARSMMDSRIIDVSFNPLFFQLEDVTTAGKNSIDTIAQVDLDLAKSLRMLNKFVDAKKAIEERGDVSGGIKADMLAQVRISEAAIEDLGLDFTLPGQPLFELVPGGADMDVTIDNLDLYIKLVADHTIGCGVEKQIAAFRAGFSQVFPYSALKAFTADELVMLFGRVEEDWNLETLTDSVKADHGYNIDSKSVRNLLQTMSELDLAARRDFLQFVTGSPKLPIGGFKSLTPMLTIVCKPSEPPLTSDDYLPSVMTCVNYLKLPDYSSLEVMREKLKTAIREGQGAFHLS